MEIKYTEDLNSTIYEDALKIRYEVFVDEQKVPADLEVDDEASCLHFVLYKKDDALATCRLYKKSAETVKLQRMAVLKSARGSKIGIALMEATEVKAAELGYHNIILGAQNTAIGFYERLGYNIIGAEFLDAGIPHHMMEKELT